MNAELCKTVPLNDVGRVVDVVADTELETTLPCVDIPMLSADVTVAPLDILVVKVIAEVPAV